MIKKGLITTALVIATSLFFFGRDAASYVCTSIGKVRGSVREAVPVTFEIDRARDMVKDLVPDIRKNMHVIAKEEVEIERLQNQIKLAEGRLDKDKTELMRLKNDLGTGEVKFTYASRTYSADQVKVDLANRFERYKTADATLASLREMQTARERSLQGAREKLEGMLAVKRKLEVEVEHLDARLKLVEAAQTTSEYQFDDSRLNRAKDLIADLRSRLDVAEKVVNSESSAVGEIQLDAPAPEKIADEVAEYFGEAKPEQIARANAAK